MTIRFIEPGAWRYLMHFHLEEPERKKLKAKMVRDICPRCSSKEEKAERQKEIKALQAFCDDERYKIIREAMRIIDNRKAKLRGRYEIAFKDEKYRDEVSKQLEIPKKWKLSLLESGGGIAF